MAANQLPAIFRMAGNPIHILCTRPVDTTLVEDAASKGIQADTLEFISTVAINNAEIKTRVNQIALKEHTVIFTSMNAVEAVTNLLDDCPPGWKIFCMGNTTLQLVINYFGKDALVSTGTNATELANEVVNYEHHDGDNGNCIFFCGDQRREELPAILEANKIGLTEITVYHTIETPHIVETHYDAILFFSPSAVHSYFKSNNANNSTLFYAIGKTTATAIKDYSDNKIIIGKTPAKDELFRLCVNHFIGLTHSGKQD